MLYYCHWPHAGDAIPPALTLSPGHSPLIINVRVSYLAEKNWGRRVWSRYYNESDACMSFFGHAACFHDVRASVYSDVLYPSSSCFHFKCLE